MKVAVIGLGRFGRSLAISLADRGVEVIAIDKIKERVDFVKDYVAFSVIMDSENEEVLKAQGVDKVDAAVVCMGENDFRSIVLTTVLLKKIGVKTVISRALEHIDREILKNVGADKVVFPEVEMGQKLARSLTSPNIIDCISVDNEDFSIAQIEAPKKFWGKKISDMQLPSRYNANIVLIKHRIKQTNENDELSVQERINYVPRADDEINEGDVLWVVGRTEDIQNIGKA